MLLVLYFCEQIMALLYSCCITRILLPTTKNLSAIKASGTKESETGDDVVKRRDNVKTMLSRGRNKLIATKASLLLLDNGERLYRSRKLLS